MSWEIHTGPGQVSKSGQTTCRGIVVKWYFWLFLLCQLNVQKPSTNTFISINFKISLYMSHEHSKAFNSKYTSFKLNKPSKTLTESDPDCYALDEQSLGDARSVLYQIRNAAGYKRVTLIFFSRSFWNLFLQLSNIFSKYLKCY